MKVKGLNIVIGIATMVLSTSSFSGSNPVSYNQMTTYVTNAINQMANQLNNTITQATKSSSTSLTAANWIAVCGGTAAAEAGCLVNTNNASFSALDAQVHISYFLGLTQPLAATSNSVFLKMYDINNINSSSPNSGPTIDTTITGSNNVLKCSFYSPTGNNILPILVNNNSTPGQPVSGYPSPTFIAPNNLNLSGTYSNVFTEAPNSGGFPASFQGFLVCINTVTNSGTPATLVAGTLTSANWT
jgi:hypothetical protein